MANLFRGEVPFKAAGLEPYVCLLNSDLAAAYGDLARVCPQFERPSPFQPDTVEEVSVPVWADSEEREPKLDEQGLQIHRQERRLVNAAERHRRWMAALEATILRPDPQAALILFRASLRQWERTTRNVLTEEQFRELADALGLAGINGLLMSAVAFGIYLRGVEGSGEEEGIEGKAVAVSASST